MTSGSGQKASDLAVTASSGNVFADLGLRDAWARQTKARLAVAINRIVEEERLPQAEAARRLGVGQPKVSALANYRLSGFSVERLMTYLNRLDRDIEIVVRPKPRSRRVAHVRVTAAKA